MTPSMEGERVEDAFRSFFEGPGSHLTDGYDPAPDDWSIRVEYDTLAGFDPDLADAVITDPDSALERGEAALKDVLETFEVNLRVHGLPDDRKFRVGKYRTRQMGELITVDGEVVDIDSVQPRAVEAAWECSRCGTLTRIPQSYGDLIKPAECMGCEAGKREAAFQFNQSQSELEDHQMIVIAPPDSSLDDPPATLAFLSRDLCDRVGPGDRISITGIYKTFPNQDEAVLDTFIDIVALDKETDTQADSMDESEVQELCYDLIEEEMGNGEAFYADREAVVERAASEGVREEEVETAIDALQEDNRVTTVGQNGLMTT